jgi:hypothetical protein
MIKPTNQPSNRFVLQNPHLIHTTPGVASVTVTLKPRFDR